MRIMLVEDNSTIAKGLHYTFEQNGYECVIASCVKDAKDMIEKDKLIQLYYNSELETAMRAGLLVIDDRDFLVEVGYIIDANETIETIDLNPTFMKRCIGAMPVAELATNLKKMSKYQIEELVEYAIQNSKELRMDRIELLGKVSGKNILKAIELLKADQEV